MSKDVLIPSDIILRWLQESSDNEDFRRRFDNYVKKNPSNWTVGD